jgi:hypothetical protein
MAAYKDDFRLSISAPFKKILKGIAIMIFYEDVDEMIAME